jgi:RHS repeat-associated protein
MNEVYTVNGLAYELYDPSSSGTTDDAYWNFAGSTSVSVQVTAPSETLSVATSGTPSNYGSPVTFTATISSGPTGTITFYDGSTAIGTGNISGTAATFTTGTLAVGTHTITAGWPGNSNYSALTSAAITQVVNQAPQTITFPAPPSPVTYGVSPIALSATASSGLAVSFNLVSGPGSVSGSTLTITGVGTVVVSASQAGNANYAAAQVTHSIVVNPATPVINWATPSSISYGAALSAAQLNATASYNGASVPGTFEYMPASGAILNAGTQQLLVFFTPTNSNDYTSASGSVMLVVNIPYSGGPAPATIYSYSITGYAPNGNLLGYTDTVTGAWSNLGYDGVNRLVAGTQTAISGEQLSVSQSFCWTYDSFGNRTAQEIGSQPFTNAAGAACQLPSNATLYGTSLANYTAANQISSTNARGVVAQPLYDASGNITYDGANFYAYDGEGQVCAMGPAPLNSITAVTQYIYDAEGTRVAKGSAHTVLQSGVYVLSCDTTVNGFTPTNLYVIGPGGEQLTETDGNGVWKHTNVYAGGALIATYDQDQSSGTQALHFQLADWLGTRRVQTDYAGNTETSFSSLPFGDQLSSLPTALPTADDATEHHFTGKERDAESGNDYFGARYYASSMGRFMSPDWSAKVMPVPYAKLDNPQSLNLYSYVWNNPLSRNDPDGHVGKCDGGNTAQCGADLAKLAPGTKLAADGTVVKAGLLQRIWNHLDGNGAGTALVSAIVNTSTVVHISTDPGSRNGSTGGDASNVYIKYDPTGSTNQTRTGPGNSAIAPVDKPGQVTLGHELIHATHIANGTIDWTGMGVHSFSDPTGNYQERWRTEEFRTVGFQGFTQSGDITEQQLRHQFGLNDRATYTNPDNWTPQQ